MKRIKYIRINLPKETKSRTQLSEFTHSLTHSLKETKDLYIKNYKTLVKEIKDDTNDGGIYHVHGSEESI